MHCTPSSLESGHMNGKPTPQAPEERSRFLKLRGTTVPQISELAATPPAELLALKQRLLITTKVLRSELAAQREKEVEDALALRLGTEEAAMAEHVKRLDAEKCRLANMRTEELERLVVTEGTSQVDAFAKCYESERCGSPAFEEAAAAHAYFLREWVSVRTHLSDTKREYNKFEQTAKLEIQEEKVLQAELEKDRVKLSSLESSLQQHVRIPFEERRKAEEASLEHTHRVANSEAREQEEIVRMKAETKTRKSALMQRLEAELLRIAKENEDNRRRESKSAVSDTSEFWQDEAALKLRWSGSTIEDAISSIASARVSGDVIHQPAQGSLPSSNKTSTMAQFIEKNSRDSGKSRTAMLGPASSSHGPAVSAKASTLAKGQKNHTTAMSKNISAQPVESKATAKNVAFEAKGESQQSPRPNDEVAVATGKVAQMASSWESRTNTKSNALATNGQQNLDNSRPRVQTKHAKFASEANETTNFILQQDEKLEIEIERTVSGDSFHASEVGSLPRSALPTPLIDDGVSEACPSEFSETSKWPSEMTSSCNPMALVRTEEAGSPRSHFSSATNHSHSRVQRIRSLFSSSKRSEGSRVRSQTMSEALHRKKGPDDKQAETALRAKSINPASHGSDRRNYTWWPRVASQQKDAFNLAANLSPSTTSLHTLPSPEHSASDGSTSGIAGRRRR